MAQNTIYHFVDNGAGWLLRLKQRWDSKLLVPERRPLVIIPGYGMNSFIFGWHPNNLSMEEYLVSKGFEVWSADLRGQGHSLRRGGSSLYHFKDIAVGDLKAVFRGVLENTKTTADKVDPVGCSLGGTYVIIHAALMKDAPFGTITAMGAPLRWGVVNPALRIAFKSPLLASLIPFGYTRQLASLLFPLLLKAPKLLEIYMHADIVDTSDLVTLLQTVDDPNRHLNEDVAWWVKRKDVVIDGVNISEEWRNVTNPFICLIGNADGIVPEDSALAALELSGAPAYKKKLLRIGDDKLKFAHADLFVSTPAPRMVFEPLAAALQSFYE